MISSSKQQTCDATAIHPPKCKDNGTSKAVEVVGGSYYSNDQVADVPVAVYSLAGAFRKGKSLMLNLFLRYLGSQKQGNPNTWLHNKEEQLREGFGLRGGDNRQTQGVWLWYEPFFVKSPAGEVAVFLMDTQEAFDSSTSVKDCSVIYALSTMISSVQIYNVMEQIQDALEYLGIFTDYGKAAHKCSSLIAKPFQNLLFLVRDWQDPDYDVKLDCLDPSHIIGLFSPHNAAIQSVNGNIVTGKAPIILKLADFNGVGTGKMPDVRTILQKLAETTKIWNQEQALRALLMEQVSKVTEMGRELGRIEEYRLDISISEKRMFYEICVTGQSQDQPIPNEIFVTSERLGRGKQQSLDIDLWSDEVDLCILENGSAVARAKRGSTTLHKRIWMGLRVNGKQANKRAFYLQ